MEAEEAEDEDDGMIQILLTLHFLFDDFIIELF